MCSFYVRIQDYNIRQDEQGLCGFKICSRFNSVQSLSHVWLFANPGTAAHQASLFITNSWSLLKLMSIELVMPSNHLISVIPFSSCLQSFPHQGLFQWVSSSHQVAKVLELQHQSFQWIFRIDFSRIDWFDLFAVKETLKSSLAPPFESINSSVFSLLYGPTHTSIHDYWKNHSINYMDFCWQSNVAAF